MADNALTKLPMAGQIGVAVVLSALVAGLFYWLSFSPMQDEEATKATQLSRLQAEIRSLEVTASKLEEFQRDVAAKEAKLETLKRILPADKETPELMKKVQYLAAQSNLSIRKFNPGATVKKSFQPAPPPTTASRPTATVAPRAGAASAPAAASTQEYYQEWPINVEVEGSYHNLGLFFDRVSRLSRLVNVGAVRIKSASKQTVSSTIAASCVATTYVYVDAPPTSASPAPAGASR